MITTPEETNVVFTGEQQKQLTAFKTRLMGLQSDISIATTTFSQTKEELKTAIKAKEYELSLLAKATEQKESALKELESVNQNLIDAKIEFAKINQESTNLTIIAQERDAKSKNREATLEVALAEHKTRVEAHGVKATKLEQDKEEILKAREILENAIDSINL